MGSEHSNTLQSLRKIKEGHEESIEIFKEFKRLKNDLGRTSRPFDDKDSILKDLIGERIKKSNGHEGKKRNKRFSGSLYAGSNH